MSLAVAHQTKIVPALRLCFETLLNLHIGIILTLAWFWCTVLRALVSLLITRVVKSLLSLFPLHVTLITVYFILILISISEFCE